MRDENAAEMEFSPHGHESAAGCIAYVEAQMTMESALCLCAHTCVCVWVPAA